MNDLQAPARLLVWVAGIVVALGLIGSLGKLTYHMAAAAIEAQQHDQMSWGHFSRTLWSQKPAHRQSK
jgi:hypothetical protein